MTKDKIYKALLIVLGLLIVILLAGIFFRKPMPDNSLVKELVKAKDSEIQSITRERDIYRQWKDEARNELLKKDSLLNTKFKTTVINYEKIPSNVRNLTNEELRRAVYSY